MAKAEEKKENEEIKSWIPWTVAVVLCLIVWAGGAWFMRLYAVTYRASFDNATAGTFGDSFGAVNALISALAFGGVIVSFWLQRKEYELQRKDLKLQYKELQAQKDEFAQQNKTMKLQRFENTFFNMMQLQQQIVNDLHLRINSPNGKRDDQGRQEKYEKDFRGRDVIRYIYKIARTLISNEGLGIYPNIIYRELLDHYFRHLYTILRYVDESDVFAPIGEEKQDENFEWKQKYHYTTIVRATLSRYEMLIIYYNGLSEFGNKKLKPLIEKYALLDNIDKQGLASSKEFREILGFNPNLEENMEYISRYNLMGTDYEYYLTEEANDERKYNIHAFGYGRKEIENARQSIRDLQVLLADLKKNEKTGKA